MALSDHKIVAFPSPASHKLEAGGICPMDIKHTHPKRTNVRHSLKTFATPA